MMQPKTRSTAIEVANRFMGSAPVDLQRMAESLGIRVDMDAHLPSNVSGKIVCRRMGFGNSYLIEINSSHSNNRKRFTLAHEIAHYILHRDVMADGVTDSEMYRSQLSDHLERQANRLAAELLMPAGLVRTIWRAGGRAINQLAETFGASPEAVRIRLAELGLGA